MQPLCSSDINSRSWSLCPKWMTCLSHKLNGFFLQMPLLMCKPESYKSYRLSTLDAPVPLLSGEHRNNELTFGVCRRGWGNINLSHSKTEGCIQDVGSRKTEQNDIYLWSWRKACFCLAQWWNCSWTVHTFLWHPQDSFFLLPENTAVVSGMRDYYPFCC